jgi:hypothetical protein
MKTPRTRLALALTAIVALFATPATAATTEEAVVPPSNSAANQYTETFPTSGGDKKTDQKPTHRSPVKVLGSQNTRKLEEQGPEGKAAAEAAAATAPTPITTTPPTPVHEPSAQSNGGGSAGGGEGGHGKGNDGQSVPRHVSGTANGPGNVSAPVPEPSGSSGLGSAIEQATGLSTSGSSGMLLPLVILTTILWSLAYLWRQRRQVD